jgi:hypothetical protein
MSLVSLLNRTLFSPRSQSLEQVEEFRALLLELHLHVESKTINALTEVEYVVHSGNEIVRL